MKKIVDNVLQLFWRYKQSQNKKNQCLAVVCLSNETTAVSTILLPFLASEICTVLSASKFHLRTTKQVSKVNTHHRNLGDRGRQVDQSIQFRIRVIAQ
jgi:hypothetical protein